MIFKKTYYIGKEKQIVNLECKAETKQEANIIFKRVIERIKINKLWK